MNNTEMIRELRSLTQAGMKDCKDALVESGWDLQKAVDIVKVKGLNVVDARAGKVAADGIVRVVPVDPNTLAMVEVNCQTDFVAGSPDFQSFVALTGVALAEAARDNHPFSAIEVEDERKALVAVCKENVVVRQWWVEQAMDPKARVFSYVHANNKIGVVLTLLAENDAAFNTLEFESMGNELAMQVAAMSPVGVSSDRVPADVRARQAAIFETQIAEMNKPAAQAVKILEGKFRKWYTEVCLLEQESVIVPKTTVKQVLENLGKQIGGKVEVVNFVRCQVGEGIEVVKENYTDEISKLSGVSTETKIAFGKNRSED